MFADARGFIDAAARARRVNAAQARCVRRGAAGARAGAALDLLLVADMVEPGSRVLDIGCGDGALLALLRDRRDVDGRGIELSREGVSDCLAKGLPVIQGDADTDLADYPGRRLRLRHPVADDPGDAPAARRAGAPAAHRPARHRLVPEFRPLARARRACAARAACR